MMTDPIADMLTRIRNAHLALHKEVSVPSSKMKEAIAAILKQEGYVDDVTVEDRNINIQLKYFKGKPAIEGDANVFEVVGNLIAYCENNNATGCGQSLAALKKAHERITTEADRYGGLENRVEMAADVLSFQKLDQQERLSYTEDIDLTELLTKLTRQQLTYQTVLQSSSMIMKLSLANYI